MGIYNLLASRRLNVFLAAAAAVYALLLVIWASMSPLDAVYRIGTSLPFKLILLLFTVNNLLCTIRQFSVSVSATKVERELLRKASAGARFVSSGPVENVDEKLSELRKRLARGGYRVIEDSQTGFAAVRGRFAPLATIVFHCALFFLVIGIVLGASTAVRARFAVAEGEKFRGGPASYVSVEPAKRRAALPRLSMSVRKIQPRFWEKELFFTDFYADIDFPADKPVGRRRVRLNVPWKPATGVYVSLVGLGYAPRYQLLAPTGQVLDEGFVKLAAFPPGARDSFMVADGRYRVDIAVYSDAVRRGKGVANRSPNLRDPIYGVRVYDGSRKSFQGLVEPNERIDLQDGLELRFPEIRYFGEFRILRSLGLPFLWAGFLLLVVSAAWRLLFYQKQVEVKVGRDGVVTAAARFDYYRVLNERRFMELMEKAFPVPRKGQE